MRYLRQVIAWIESEKCMTGLEKLGRSLQEEGIAFRCFLREYEEDSRYVVNCGNVGTGETAAADRTGTVKQIPRLWITDRAYLASALLLKGEAVLALLHEDNNNQDFSGILYACEHPEELDGNYMERVYRRYAGLPWDVIETDRCIIRETTEADVEALFQIYSHPEITRYTEKLYPTVEQEKEYVREYIEKVYGFFGFGVWTVLKKETGEIIGRAGFSYREGFEEPEIGFVIGVPWQRRGYAEEVCRELLRYGQEELGFSCVQAFVMPENVASVQLCEKLGLHKVDSKTISGILYNRFLTDLSIAIDSTN